MKANRQDLENQISIAEYYLKLMAMTEAERFDCEHKRIWTTPAPNISHTIRPWQFGSSWKTSVETHNK